VAITASAVLVVAGGVVLVRAETMTTPRLRARVVLSTMLRFPGRTPTLAWPTTGEAAVSVDGIGDLGDSGGDTPEPIASVAKIMTAYLILRAHPVAVAGKGFTVTITAADVADQEIRAVQGQSTIPVQQGEVLDEYQMLEALLLPSANNIAAVLATYEAGSIPAFVKEMNTEAKALGMTHTEYTDPSGYTSTTVSTAADQLRLARVVMRIPAFAAIVDMQKVTLPVAGTVANYNTLIGKDGFVGVKTGSDGEAGGCLVFADERTVAGRHVTIMGVILGQDRFDTNTATILAAAAAAASKLAVSATASLAVRDVLPAGRAAVELTDAAGHRVVATTVTPVRQLGWGGLDLRVHIAVAVTTHTLLAGQSVATVSVDGHIKRASTTVKANATMPKLTFGWRLDHAV
jgi:D-alanyl-D-alanine carboxypeptidase (penicillin-binding protein 5/6)